MAVDEEQEENGHKPDRPHCRLQVVTTVTGNTARQGVEEVQRVWTMHCDQEAQSADIFIEWHRHISSKTNTK